MTLLLNATSNDFAANCVRLVASPATEEMLSNGHGSAVTLTTVTSTSSRPIQPRWRQKSTVPPMSISRIGRGSSLIACSNAAKRRARKR